MQFFATRGEEMLLYKSVAPLPLVKSHRNVKHIRESNTCNKTINTSRCDTSTRLVRCDEHQKVAAMLSRISLVTNYLTASPLYSITEVLYAPCTANQMRIASRKFVIV